MDQFWVLAHDGREYGPADLPTLIQWVRDGRVSALTAVRRGTGYPQEARAIPEIAAFFTPGTADGFGSAAGGSGATAGGSGSASGGAGATPGAWPAAPAVPAPIPQELRVWRFIGLAWDVFKPHWILLSAMFFLFKAIEMMPYVGGIAWLILGGPLMVGVWGILLSVVDGRTPTLGMMFERFDRFLDAFLAQLIMAILVVVGCLFFIVPGIILMIIWMFTYPILAETNLGFWEAMRASAALTKGYRWRLFFFGLAACLLLLVGLCVFLVGVFVALAVVFTALALIYRFLQAKQRQAAPAFAA
jgi:uncharacterized membrane protein